MSEGRPVCSKPGGWFEIAGHPVGYSAVEGAVKAISVLVMICYLRWNRWRASRGHLSAAQTLIFPIYGYIIYMVGFIDLAQAIVLEAFFEEDSAPPIVVAICWAASRFVTEGMVFFLIHSGVGVASIRRSIVYAVIWAIFSLAAFYFVQLEKSRTPGHIVALAYLSPPWIFYCLLALTPIRCCPRRPAVRPVSILMLAVFTTQIVREALLHQHDFQGDECWAWSSWSLLLWALFPWVVYCSLVMDSQYWQGLYSDPEAANLNTPLLGVWGALPETPASTLASCICDLEAGEMVPIIPFSQLKLRTDVKFSSGSNSRVYQGEFRGEIVAVKMLFTIELDSSSIRSFCDEARVLHSLRHPNVLACRGVCILPPAICLVTEYCEKGSLYEFLKQQVDAPTPLSWEIRSELMIGCAAGVEHLHGRGLVHGDIKSLNFLVRGDMTIKLADLGECRKEGQVPENGEQVKPATANWSAPEVLAGVARQYTQSMDIYSLGLVLNEIMTLQVPYYHEPYLSMDREEFIEHVFRLGGRPPLSHKSPPALKDLLLRCWHGDPATRPTASEVLKALKELWAEVLLQPPSSPPSGLVREASDEEEKTGSSDAIP